jgi:hypothetical protein
MENDATEIESLKALEAGVSSKTVSLPADVPKDHSFYVQITGRNSKGKDSLNEILNLMLRDFIVFFLSIAGDSFVRLSQELTIPYEENATVEEKFGKIVDGTEIETEGIGRGFANIQAERSTENNNTKEIGRQSQVKT